MINVLLQDWDTPFQIAPFDAIKDEDFAPALDVALEHHQAEIDAIAKMNAPAKKRKAPVKKAAAAKKPAAKAKATKAKTATTKKAPAKRRTTAKKVKA